MKKKMNFSLNVNALPDFTNQLNPELLMEAITLSRVASYADIMTGIKHKEALNYATSEIILQSGTCGWTPTGSTTLTQLEVMVSPIKIQKEFCPADLEKKWAGMYMKSGVAHELPFPEAFRQVELQEISDLVTNLLWRGDLTGSTQNLNVADGFEKHIRNSSEVIRPAATTGSTWNNSTNILNSIDAIVNAIPSEILFKDDLVLFVDYGTFRTYQQALINANRPSVVTSTGPTNYEMFIPGFNIRVVADRISNGKYALTYADNMLILTDFRDEEERVEFFWDKSDQIMKFFANFKLGTDFRFKQYIVSNI